MTETLLYSLAQTWYDLYMTQDTVTLSYLEQYAPALAAEMISLALAAAEDQS